jgi:hypothetical protein
VPSSSKSSSTFFNIFLFFGNYQSNIIVFSKTNFLLLKT